MKDLFILFSIYWTGGSMLVASLAFFYWIISSLAKDIYESSVALVAAKDIHTAITEWKERNPEKAEKWNDHEQ